jgi:hypothetical protein
MKLVGAGGQQVQHILYDASGTITTGGTAQLVLARSLSRSYFFFQNNSPGAMFLEFGGPRAIAVLTSGAVSSCTVTNAGFNYTKPPLVRFLGGGIAQGTFASQASGPNSSYLGLNQPNGPSPANAATGIAVLSGNALASIQITNPGAGYVIAPYVLLINSDLDPYGCAVPSNGVGMQIGASGGSTFYNGTMCPTDPVAVWGATTTQAFCCKWAD